MNLGDIRKMPIEEVRKLAWAKNQKGNATTDAKKAQRVLIERHGDSIRRDNEPAFYDINKDYWKF